MIGRVSWAVAALLVGTQQDAWSQPSQPSVPGGGGGGQGGRQTETTNRLDLDMDGAIDFEIITKDVVSWNLFFGEHRSTEIRLAPLRSCQILATTRNQITGDLPLLEKGSPVGAATAPHYWSTNSHSLISFVQGSFLSGPLSGIWMGQPGAKHLGVSLGTPDAPIYAWLCFERDRGSGSPMYWGYGRQVHTPVTVGDLSSAPSLRLIAKPEIAQVPGSTVKWRTITWEPGFADVILEERLGLDGPWTRLIDDSAPRFPLPHYNQRVNDTSPNSEQRFYRLRFGP